MNKVNLIKNILIAGVLASTACNESADRILYSGPDFVFLDSKEQISLYENQKTALIIPVKVSLVQAENTNVTFEVIGSNVLPVTDYKIQTGSPVQIARGKYVSNISILPVDNSIIQPEKRTITVKITSVDNPKLQLQVVRVVEINLLDDDCLSTVPKVSLWVGSVTVTGGLTGTGEGGAGGICGGSLVVTAPFFGTQNGDITMTIIMTQSTITPTQGTASVVRFPLFAGSTTYEYEASGTYDEISKTIALNYTVYNNTDHTQDFTGTHTITPK